MMARKIRTATLVAVALAAAFTVLSVERPLAAESQTKAILSAAESRTKAAPSAAGSQTEATPYAAHGALHVEGARLADSHGADMQLYGMSTHGLAWFPQYVDPDAFRTLRDDWGTNCVRLALYTDEYGGYCSGGDRAALKKLVEDGVGYATEFGMYAVVDWHVLNDHDPNVHKQDALEFFDAMSGRFKDQDNVIYEICNEPNSGATWDRICAYANEVIPVIRKNDPNAVIIVGTPVWSQEIDKALEAPLPYDNIMYALHFYAATHTDWLRERCERCVQAGLPVFVSEFGICDASGNGRNDFAQAEQWMQLIDRYGLSYCCWNLANKNETSSVIRPECAKTSGWTEDDLSESGRWIRGQFQKETSRHLTDGSGPGSQPFSGLGR